MDPREKEIDLMLKTYRQERARKELRRLRLKRFFTLLLVLLLLLGTAGAVYFFLIPRDEAEEPPVTTDAPETTVPPETEPPVPEIAYTTVTFSRDEVARGDLILVNDEHPYVFPEDESHLGLLAGWQQNPNYLMAFSLPMSLKASALEAFNAIFSGENTPVPSNVCVASAYCSRFIAESEYEAMQAKGMEGLASLAFEPCTGLNLGLCFLSSKTGTLVGFEEVEDDPQFAWFMPSFTCHGFIQRYPKGKAELTGIETLNIFRYVGVPHAAYIAENGLCLEEYLEAVRAYPDYENHLPIQTEDDAYAVWYVPAAEVGDTEIRIPEGFSYTVSGDNIGGFVVTVTLPHPAA